MEKINQTNSLEQTILYLQDKQALELHALKQQFELTYESIKPINLIKSVFTEMTTSPNIKGNIVNNIVGMAIGYLTRRVLVGSTRNPIKKILGTLLQFVVTNVTTKHSNY
ncbi:hypothetical protein ACM55G_07855 [Flavobacterium sp. LB3P122]|uniref:hypothetical protein n=1 Tax=Flavobacterium algoriphilum TaxID=3398738 RepID=UPI003A85137E